MTNLPRLLSQLDLVGPLDPLDHVHLQYLLDPQDLLDAFEAYRPPQVEKWIADDER